MTKKVVFKKQPTNHLDLFWSQTAAFQVFGSFIFNYLMEELNTLLSVIIYQISDAIKYYLYV